MVDITNLSNYETNATLNVYCNGEIIKEIFINIKGEQVLQEEYYFENLKENDYLYFEIVTERKDSFSINNNIGIYSIMDSKVYDINQNMYQFVLDFAKRI